MSNEITIGILLCTVLAIGLLVGDYFRGRKKRALFGSVSLLLFLLILHLATGFPAPNTAQAFGGGLSVEWAIIAMFGGVLLGVVAQQVFSRPATFSIFDFVRPVVVSPLVLLPLIGSLQGGPLETIQAVSLVLLAFQNGFFWQQVLKDAKPRA